MKKSCLFLAVFALLSYQCHARIGESSAQLEKRFGPPIRELKQPGATIYQNQYINSDILILATICNGASVVEHYMKLKSVPVGNEAPVLILMPVELAAAILQANTEGSQWDEVENNEHTRRLVRADKKALAVIVKEKQSVKEVRISSVDFAEALAGRTSSGQNK
ncbi:MAG: hypothetical protein PHD76_00025 [Methylacidiphilales bacterium]|nr:hypothetical protein [Candidatus Methylacidiphilales bacterium]